MKKAIIASIVGGIIIFAAQFLSWAAMNMHKAAYGYTPNSTAILAALETNLPKEGGYMVPGLPETATREEHEKMMKECDGKPWATIQYHKAMKANASDMMTNMAHALVVDIIMVLLFCWMIGKMNMPGFGTIFISSLFVGLIAFIHTAYVGNIWFQWFDIMAHFTDALMSWGVCGLWLGWYLKKK